MKASIGFWTQAVFFTTGTGGVVTAWKAQCLDKSVAGRQQAVVPAQALIDPGAQEPDLGRAEPFAARRHDLVVEHAGDEVDQPALAAIAEAHERLAVGFAEDFCAQVEAVARLGVGPLVALETVGCQEGVDILTEVDGLLRHRRQQSRIDLPRPAWCGKESSA